MAMDFLREEHDAIRRELASARHQSEVIAHRGEFDAEEMNALVLFLKDHVDRRHFKMEERCLRPILRRQAMTEQHGIMLNEHRTLRRHRRQLAAALLAAEQGEDLAIPKVLDLLQALTELLERHLEWEERELYPPIAHSLSQENRLQLEKCLKC